MTRKQLRRQRVHRECAAYFMLLARDPNPNLRKRLPRMRALAERHRYHSDSTGARKCHKRRSAAMNRFRARARFYAQRSRGFINEHTFIYRPHVDATTGKPSGYFEWLDQQTGMSWFFVPVKRRAWTSTAANTSAARTRRGAPMSNDGSGTTTSVLSIAIGAASRSTRTSDRRDRHARRGAADRRRSRGAAAADD